MTETLVHRGPDAEGYWEDHEDRVYLGFRRLSIQDLSEAGHQPMVSPSGRYVMAFNGEVYNFPLLRDELSRNGFTFRGRSDTEVILAALERWGPSDALPRLRGMFSIALWDRQERSLLLARDRLGIKPLYVAEVEGSVVFASELRAMLMHPKVHPRGNAQGAWHFLRYLYVPAPLSMIEGVEKILPGTVVLFRQRSNGSYQREDTKYWDVRTFASRARRELADPISALNDLHRCLSDSVRMRLIADVPIGALLSGGIDSSLIVALMQEEGDERARTFTIRFDDSRFDEGPVAARIAAELGTRHTEVELPASRAQELIPTLARSVDEPLANPSFLPTLLVSEVARNDVVVALSGDGGDELFGGYNRYVHAERLLGWARRMPGSIRLPIRAVLGWMRERPWVEPLGRAALPAGFGEQQTFASRLDRLSSVLGASSHLDAYQELMAVGGICPPVSGSFGHRFESDAAFEEHPGTLIERMMLHDQLQYLPGDLLAKVDRASMWVSLEVRVPLLDHEVVEMSWDWPSDWKIRGRHSKWPLRQLLLRYLPPELVDRPKMGFTVPLEEWLRGDLREWAESILSPSRMAQRGVWDLDSVRVIWSGFKSGRRDLALPAWAILVLEDWCRAWGVEFGLAD